jgi:mannose-1-phosphate guanylyltransferase/mannose-6-phosphate isomerase
VIIAIIAGGAGTRLWPLSTPDFPKHLLKVGGSDRSLLQDTYDRAKQLTKKIYVVSEQGHIDLVRDQLSELFLDNFLIEPARKGTANCIMYTLVKLSNNHNPNEPLIFIHADHYIRDTNGFIHSFKQAAAASLAEQKIVLVGVEPNYAATGFGYIKRGILEDAKRSVYRVEGFKEKPDFQTAQKFVKSGNYLWNCGYFVGSINIFKAKMKQYAPELLENFNKLNHAKNNFKDVYLGLAPEAIDNALIEKVQDLLVVPASFDWMDIGSYADLLKSVDTDENGNYLKGNIEISEVKNSFIENREAKPLSVIGIDNCVVVNTKDGIVVSRIDLSQRIGDVAKKIYDRRTK